MIHPNHRDEGDTMTAERAELRERIVRRLSNDEWMQPHFGIACNPATIAAAVMELFDEMDVQPAHRRPHTQAEDTMVTKKTTSTIEIESGTWRVEDGRRCRGCGRRMLLWRWRWAHRRCAGGRIRARGTDTVTDMIRMLLGAVLIAAVLFVLTALVAAESSWPAALATWLFVLILLAAFIGGISLLTGGRR